MRDHETIHAAIAGVKVSFHGGRGPLHGCAAPPACAHADLGAPRPQAGAALRGGRAEFASRGRAAPRNFAAFRAGFARRQSGATPAIGYRYPLLFPTRPFMEVAVAQPREIACMRISAIASRGTKRDFVDLYFVAQTHGLRALFRHFAAKYAQTNYSPLHIAKSLTFFEDAEKDPMPDMLAVCDWAVVKQYFSHEAPRLL
ncbi:MAG TPA: nucleotidyl transferase AbiEii/AbiGii toxin family protein [Terriglobales bacterium]|nr:nucleotidyl transferase AbiEii/AbiGii toxin family protein [Terriglobales bacterium]